MDEQQKTHIDLDGLIARFGRKLAQAELEAEVATQQVARLQDQLEQLLARVAELEADRAS